MRDIVLVTCGTSLLGGMKRDKVEPEGFSRWFKSHDASYGNFGAEMNSLWAMGKEYPEEMEPREAVLYLSDTEDGKKVGGCLAQMIPELLGLSVQSRVISGLDMDRPEVFRREGLCNLVGAMAKDLRNYGESRSLICSTGGFKAMVGIAQTFANAVSVPAYYRFENARSGMMMPPLPVGFDLALWLRLYEGLSLMVEEDTLEEKSLKPFMQSLLPEDRMRFQVMLERDGSLCALTFLGKLFYETGNFNFSDRSESLLPPAVEEGTKDDVSLDSGVQNSGKEAPANAFEKKNGIGRKLYGLPYVGKVWIHYFNIAGGRGLARCHIKEAINNILEVEWCDGKSLIKYKLEISKAQSLEQLQAAVADINEHLKTGKF